MTVSLCQTLVLINQVLYPLLLPPFQEGVPEGNPLRSMERFTPMIPSLIWVLVSNAHVIIVQANKLFNVNPINPYCQTVYCISLC